MWVNASLVAPTLDKIRDSIGTKYFLNFEGLNEPETWNDNDAANWPATTRAVQQAIYNKMKSDAAWNSVKVLGPSIFDYPSFQLLGDIRSITDYGNMHWYPQDRESSAADAATFGSYYDLARQYCYNDTRPIVLSETGYNNQITLDLPESESAKYMLRNFMYLLYTKNMDKVFNYQFLDEGTDRNNYDQTWGILRADCSEKPAYGALRNTINLLKDPGANFTPGALTYELTGSKTNIYKKLFQKSNGIFYLVIWQEARGYNLNTKKLITIPERALTLNFSSAIASAKIYRPTPLPIGNGLTPTNTYTNPTSINLSVPDQVMIIELIPAGVTVTAVTGVSVDPATATIEVTNTQQLTATIIPANATNQLVSWSTSDAAVATVSAAGLVTGVSAGNATITITTADGAKTATSSIKVTAPPPSPWTNADDTDPAWVYKDFIATDCGTCFNATVHYTETVGSTAEYPFTGTDVEAYCEAFDGAGSVDVYIDGILKGNYSQQTEPYGGAKIFASFSGLANGAHTFKMVTKAPYPGIDYIRFKKATATFSFQLISFTAQNNSGKVNLNWVTANELNVVRFEIERSADSINFVKIKEINSKGSGSYNAVDDMPMTGNNYYRIKIVGKDSSSNYCVVRLIKVAKDKLLAFSVYPNPAKDKLTIILPDLITAAKVTIINQQGQKVLVKEITDNTPLSITHLSKGIYIVQLNAKGQTKTIKIIKE